MFSLCLVESVSIERHVRARRKSNMGCMKNSSSIDSSICLSDFSASLFDSWSASLVDFLAPVTSTNIVFDLSSSTSGGLEIGYLAGSGGDGRIASACI